MSTPPPSDLFGPYSPLKILHHPGRLKMLRCGLQPTPAHVQIILSDLCNQSCQWCSYRVEGNPNNAMFPDPVTGSINPKRMLHYDKVLEILDDCVELGVAAIQLTGGGEPTVHPRFLDVLHQVAIRDLDLALVTNGVRLTENIIWALMKAKWVRVSVDAATAATYGPMRSTPPEHFAKVCEHVKALALAKEVSGSALELGVGFVVSKENWREILAGTALARSLEADNIRLSAAFMPDDETYHADHFEAAADLCRQAVAEHDGQGGFRVYNRFGERLEDLRQHHPEYSFCGYQHFTTYIGGDLNVYRCCTLAYNPRGLIGNLEHQRFRDLWRSEAKTAAFKDFDARGCPRCQFNGINRTINYALDSHAPSVTFV